MCGLFGFSGHQPVDITKLRWGLALNESRGRSSTGVFSVKEDKKATQTLYKKAKMASKFILDRDFTETVRGATSVIGHTRAATVGAVNDPNSHPFLYDFTGKEHGQKVVLAHNGFAIEELWDRYSEMFNFDPTDINLPGFDKDKGKKGKFEVDSMIIAAVLAKTGDYKVLPSIEGSIIVSFMMPDKYPGVVFLYKRASRSLHFGKSREGIYWSSEEEPLQLIGCEDVIQVPDDHILLLKDGEILDIEEMKKPRIILPLDTQRGSWKEKVDKSEYAEYAEIEPEEKPKTYYNNTYPQAKTIWDKSSGEWVSKWEADRRKIKYEWNTKSGAWEAEDYPESFTRTNISTTPTRKLLGGTTETTGIEDVDLFDELNSLVTDVKQELETIDRSFLAIVKNHEGQTIENMEECLMILKLVASPNNMDCMGWLVFCKEVQSIQGATSLNGIACLSFERNDCDKAYELTFVDPVDPSIIFTHEVKPKSGRVLEVTLTLPFPEKEKKLFPDNLAEARKELSDKAIDLGTDVSDIVYNRAPTKQLVLSIENHCSFPISRPKDEVHIRSTPRGFSGGDETDVQETKGNAGTTSQSNCRVKQTNLKYPAEINLLDLAVILKKEEQTFGFKDTILGKYNTREYTTVSGDVRNYFSKYLNIKKLVHDAAVLKENDIQSFKDSHSLSLYVYDLLLRIPDNYFLEMDFSKGSQNDIGFKIVRQEYKTNKLIAGIPTTIVECNNQVFDRMKNSKNPYYNYVSN